LLQCPPDQLGCFDGTSGRERSPNRIVRRCRSKAEAH